MTDLSARLEKPSRGTAGFRQDVLGLILLAAGSLGIGLLVNGLRPVPLPLIYTSPKDRLGVIVTRMSTVPPASRPSTSAPVQWQEIGLGEFQEFVTARRGIIIDARPTAFYRAGHVPGALSLPREDFEKGYAEARRSLEPAKQKPVAIYCSEADCKDSDLVANALTRLGYRRLSVYKEGWEEWLRAGLPQEVGGPP